VVTSVTEAEYSAVFNTTQDIITIHKTLITLGHPQPPTPIITDNTVACGIVTNNYKPEKTRAANMRYQYLHDKLNEQLIDISWDPGHSNLADYFTKNFHPSHHRKLRNQYVLNSIYHLPIIVRGCVNHNMQPLQNHTQFTH